MEHVFPVTLPAAIPDALRDLAAFWREIASERRRDSDAAGNVADNLRYGEEARDWRFAAASLETVADKIEAVVTPIRESTR